MSKAILGGNIYLVEYLGEDWRVHKVSSGAQAVYDVDRDGVCSCPAGQHGRDCKHLAMAMNELEGEPHTRGAARRKLNAWLDKCRQEMPGGKFTNLVNHSNNGEKFTVATALATGIPVKCADAPRFTLWTEAQGLLIRVHVFEDANDYREQFSRIRAR